MIKNGCRKYRIPAGNTPVIAEMIEVSWREREMPVAARRVVRSVVRDKPVAARRVERRELVALCMGLDDEFLVELLEDARLITFFIWLFDRDEMMNRLP